MTVRPTVSDVARIVGFSPSTVSRALSSDSGRVASGTRARIVAAAREIGYTPNRAARELTTGRSHTIGFVVPDIENPYFSSVLKGVQLESQHEDFSVFVADSNEEPRDEYKLADRLISQVDGLILCSSRMSDEQVQRFADLVPVVLVNRRLNDIPSVTMDECQIIRQAIEHLYALGHRCIAYAGGPATSWTAKQRLLAIADLRESLSDVTISEFGPFNPVFNSGATAIDLALAAGATGFVACNDLVAMGAMARLRNRGMSVPQRMSIVGIDDSMSASLVSPALTSVHTSKVQLGRSAMSAIIDLLDDKPAPLPIVGNIELRIRESTATIMSPAQPVR